MGLMKLCLTCGCEPCSGYAFLNPQCSADQMTINTLVTWLCVVYQVAAPSICAQVSVSRLILSYLIGVIKNYRIVHNLFSLLANAKGLNTPSHSDTMIITEDNPYRQRGSYTNAYVRTKSPMWANRCQRQLACCIS